MPHSLRARLSGLRYKGIITDKDYQRLCKALDMEKVLEDIKAEIEQSKREAWCEEYADGLYEALDIIDKHIGERSE